MRSTGTYLEHGVLTSSDNLLCGNGMKTALSLAANQTWRISSELPTIHSVAESDGLSDVLVLRSAEFLGESDQKPFRPTDVAEPIRVFILDYFAYELRAALAQLFKRLVDVVHGEHDTEVA